MMAWSESGNKSAGSPPVSSKSIVQDFLKTTSVKGIPKIVKAQTQCVRALWLLALLFGILVAVTFAYNLFSGFFSYDVIISMEESSDNLRFPDLTLCSVNPLSPLPVRPAHLQEFIKVMTSPLESLKNSTDFRYASDFVLPEVIFENYVHNSNITGHDLKPFIIECRLIYLEEDERCPLSVKDIYMPKYGFCYTVQPPIDEGLQGVVVLLYVSNSPKVVISNFYLGLGDPFADALRVIVHDEGTVPWISRDSLILQRGKHTTIKIAQRDRQQKSGSYSDCQEQPRFQHRSLAENMTYTRATCQDLCVQEAVMTSCGCVAGNYASVASLRADVPFCGVLDMTRDMTAQVREYGMRADCVRNVTIRQGWEAKCGERCAEPCYERHYDVMFNQIDWPHPAIQLALYDEYIKGRQIDVGFKIYEEAKIIMRTNWSEAYQMLVDTDEIVKVFAQVNFEFASNTVTHFVDKPAYTISGLVGSLGGIFNLWVGLSFITMIEVIELCYKLASHQKESKTSVQTIEVRECSS